MARTRSRQRQLSPAEKHKEWVENWRKDPANLKKELKARVLNRVKKGAVPNVNSMAKYGITLEDINLLRAEYGYEPLIITVPMFLRERDCGDIEGRTADNIPAVSDVVDDIGRREQEVEQRPRPTPESVARDTELLQRSRQTFQRGKLDAKSINIFMRNNPTRASRTRQENIKPSTLAKQYGGPRAKDDVGMFPRFMLYLGQKYYDDVSEVYTPSGIAYIKKRLYEPRENAKLKDGKTYKGGSKYMAMKTTQQQFETLLKVLQYYPAFDYHNTQNRALKMGYEELDRFNTELKAIGDSESIVSIDDKDPVLPWDEIVRKVFDKYPGGSKERLYIQMYGQFPSRDDFGSLWVDDTDTDIPEGRRVFELVKKNTLFIPNNRRRKSEKRAVFVLKDYKTSSIYGTRRFEFSPDLTKEILKYVKKNDITGKTKNLPYLFGSGAMSQWVGKLLDKIGIENRKKANINYLRRSYVSTEFDKEGITPEQRVKLAWDMKHSPAGSLKYWRNLVSKEPELAISTENIEKANRLKNVDGS